VEEKADNIDSVYRHIFSFCSGANHPSQRSRRGSGRMALARVLYVHLCRTGIDLQCPLPTVTLLDKEKESRDKQPGWRKRNWLAGKRGARLVEMGKRRQRSHNRRNEQS